jgi:hypothetical protein
VISLEWYQGSRDEKGRRTRRDDREDPYIRDNDVPEVSRLEELVVNGDKVVHVAVLFATGGVHDEVKRESEDLRKGQVQQK